MVTEFFFTNKILEDIKVTTRKTKKVKIQKVNKRFISDFVRYSHNDFCYYQIEKEETYASEALMVSLYYSIFAENFGCRCFWLLLVFLFPVCFLI